jgi:hypothetical protein
MVIWRKEDRLVVIILVRVRVLLVLVPVLGLQLLLVLVLVVVSTTTPLLLPARLELAITPCSNRGNEVGTRWKWTTAIIIMM